MMKNEMKQNNKKEKNEIIRKKVEIKNIRENDKKKGK